MTPPSTPLQRITQEVDLFAAHATPSVRIGISANSNKGTSCIADGYVQSVLLAGGTPLLLPVMDDLDALTALVKSLDGIIFSGGGDIDASYLDEEPIPELGTTNIVRDRYDLLLLRIAFNHQVPIMGICRGHQLINVAFGGTLYQDIHAQFSSKALQHDQTAPRHIATHDVLLTDGATKLRRAVGGKHLMAVNSLHHQAVKSTAPEFFTTAIAPDGVNEAIEHLEYPIFSVQWHPEAMAAAGNEEMLDLFRFHYQQAFLFQQAKKLHQKIVTIDSHTDTPMLFEQFDLSKKEGGKVNLPLMREGRVDAAFMVAYLPQGARDEASLKAATAYAEDRLQQVILQAERYPHLMGIAGTEEELLQLKQADKKAIFLGIENGYAIGKELENLRRFKEMKVSYITLCHNGDNDLCDSAVGDAEWGGLSPFGREVVAEMNRLGMMIDLSHAAESTFYDVIRESRAPIIASHSSAYALTPHPRNLTDHQIKTLAEHEGVVQICLYKGFLNKNPEEASLTDAIRHITHVIDLVGVDFVGIGSDFDGDGEIIGCRAANELIQITMRLIELGLSDEELAKIWGGNLLRVMKQNRSFKQT